MFSLEVSMKFLVLSLGLFLTLNVSFAQKEPAVSFDNIQPATKDAPAPQPGPVTPLPVQPQAQIQPPDPGPAASRDVPRTATAVPDMVSRSDLVMCPIIDRSVQVRRETASTVDDVRAALAAAQQALGRGRSQDCQTVGSQIQYLVGAFQAQAGAPSLCESNPQSCASRFADVLPIIDRCTESRGALADMATSVALNLTAGSPAGLITLGVAGFRSILNLFRDRSQAQAERELERGRVRQREEVLEAAASCGMMSLYFSSVCAPASSYRLSRVLRGLEPVPRCQNPLSIGMTDARGGAELKAQISSIIKIDSCTQREANKSVCFREPYLPAASAGAPAATAEERVACLASEISLMGSNVSSFKTNDIPEMLKLARRHHTKQIIALRDRLRSVSSVDENTAAERTKLVTQCFYGKVARSVSSTDPTAEITADELRAQDEADRRTIYRGDRSRDRVSIADNAAEVDSICNQVDRCIRSDRTASRSISMATFGPTGASVATRMCNGLAKFNEFGVNYLGGDTAFMEAAVGDGGTYGQNCTEPTSTPGAQPATGEGTRVQGT